MADLGTLPRWEMSTIFPSLEAPEFSTAFEKAKHDSQDLSRLF